MTKTAAKMATGLTWAYPSQKTNLIVVRRHVARRGLLVIQASITPCMGRA